MSDSPQQKYNPQSKSLDTFSLVETLDGMDERQRLELKIAEIESKIRANKSRHKIQFIIPISFLVIGTFLICFGRDLLSLEKAILYGWVSIGYGFIGIISLYFMSEVFNSRQQTELDVLCARRRILFRFEEQARIRGTASEESYFDTLVKINVDNLGAYYTLIKVHTDNSFKVTLSVGIIGFILISIGLTIGFTNGMSTKFVSYVASASGIITEFIAGIFFFLYTRTIRQLKSYHDSLLIVQNILLSFKLVGDISNEEQKAKMMTQMLGFLINQEANLPSTSIKK